MSLSRDRFQDDPTCPEDVAREHRQYRLKIVCSFSITTSCSAPSARYAEDESFRDPQLAAIEAYLGEMGIDDFEIVEAVADADN